jgi:glycerophosphoryl diester phosphodiesterase
MRTSGHRSVLAAVFVAWAFGGALFSAVAFGAGAGLARWLVAIFQNSMLFLPVVMGGLFLLASLMSFALTWVQAAFFVLLTLRLYRREGAEGTSLPSLGERFASDSANSIVSFKSLLAALVAGTLVAGVTGFFLVDGVRMDDDVLVIAHRGAAGRAPENTLAAFAAAIEDGADLLEIDVQETIDGEVVVIHDSDFMKIAGDPRKVWDVTYEETRAIDIGSWFGPEFSSERLPTLEEVLELARGKVRVDIELKYYGHDERLEERVVSIVEDTDMVPEVVIMSLNQAAIRKIRTLRPSWTIGLLTATALGNLTRVDADFLAVHTGMATSPFVRSAHKVGKDVYVWTVNDAANMSRMVGRGVDGIITDEPALAKRVLAERAELSSLERLLLEAALWLGEAPPERSPSTDVPPEALP